MQRQPLTRFGEKVVDAFIVIVATGLIAAIVVWAAVKRWLGP